ncbi:MAG TPA: ATP-binding protein [Myxococcales bacterium]|jgi:PAS domain S-box-containing protein
MRRRSDSGSGGSPEELRRRIIGLGEQSLRKSYYPELRRRLDELERFRTLLDQASDAIFLIELPGGRLADVSEAACRMLGRPREGLVGKQTREALPEIAELARVPSGGTRRIATLHGAGGVAIPVEVQVAEVAFERSRYVVAVARDVTERRRAEEALEFLVRAGVRLGASLDVRDTVESVLALAIERLAEVAAVYQRRPDGSLLRLGMACRHAEHREIAQELQRRFPMPEGDQLGVGACLVSGEEQRLRDITDEGLEASVRDPEERRLWGKLGMHCALVLPLTSRGSVRGGLLLANLKCEERWTASQAKLASDFASRAAAALQNAELYRDVREANHTKDEFLAIVSHELRTPLTSILGWSTLLGSRGSPRPDQVRGLAAIERNARSLAQIIDDLLDVSRIAAGKVQLVTAPIDLTHVVQVAVETVRPVALSHALALEVIAAPLPHYLGDAKRLEQVVWNLVSNAVKFTPPGGRVEVRLEGSLEGPRIVVRDTGRGIDPAFLPHVFEPFRQADSSTTRRFGGLGLGLAIVQRLVRLHGGTVSAQSEGEGRGTTFTVSLPPRWATADARPESATAEGRSTYAQELAGIKALVVDDDPDTRELIGELLRDEGAEFQLAADVPNALAALERGWANVLLSDLAMPGEDGFALLREARERGITIPAAALTAMVRPEDARRAMSAGFDRFVKKPVDPRQLVIAVGELVPVPSRAGPLAPI